MTLAVLVVDDDPMVAELHRRVVDALPGFRVVGVAHTGAQALAAVAATRPDLVLLDVHLPDLTGVALLQRLRAAGDPVGVIMVTAARELDTVGAALDGGAADYLVKPFELEHLREKVTTFAARTAALRARGGADQKLIDTLFGAAPTAAPPVAPRPVADTALPKGLAPETGDAVMTAVRDAGEVSAAECAETVGVSRVSARRYLDHFHRVGDLELRLQYGVGRPQRRYRLPGGRGTPRRAEP